MLLIKMNMNLNEIITKKMEAQVLTKTSYKNFLFNWSNSPPMLDYLIKKKKEIAGAKLTYLCQLGS